MKAIILAAGYATRLYPLTKNKPKALLTINDRAIIDYICDEIDSIDDINEILVVSNHKFVNEFKKWSEKRNGKKSIKVLDDGSTCEDDKLGAIGDIKHVLHSENIDEDILVIAGDTFFTYKLTDFYNFFININKDTIIVKEIDNLEDLKRMGVVKIDKNNKIIDFVEKPETPESNLGAFASYIYKKDTLPLFEVYLNEGNKPDAPGYFSAWLCKNKEMFAFPINGECYDIGTPTALNDVRNKFKK